MKNGTKQAFVFPETGKRKVTFHLQTATNHKEVEILGRNVSYIWGLTKALYIKQDVKKNLRTNLRGGL